VLSLLDAADERDSPIQLPRSSHDALMIALKQSSVSPPPSMSASPSHSSRVQCYDLGR
jgi:hypothetical protein